ncbi:hypothetical protein EDD15DRAFT_2521622 [Pisolithus albus]|nr:hypothetical protein EDD15DRAFT_2521622 [Pisolithus albus]
MSRNTDTVTTSPSILTSSISASEQTADGVPDEVFEALIDILTSGGIDDARLSTSPVPRWRKELCSGTNPEDLIWRRYGVCLKARATRRRVGKRVLDSFGGPAQTDVVSRRDHLNDTLGGARDEVRTLPRLYDELRKVRLEKGKGLKASERRSTQVVTRAQDSKICRDAIAPSDLRVPAPTVQDGTEVGPQVAIGGGSEYGPKHDGDGGIAVEVARLSGVGTRRAPTARDSILAIATMTIVLPSLLLPEDPGSAPFKRTRGNLNPWDIRRAPRLRGASRRTNLVEILVTLQFLSRPHFFSR